MSYNFSYNTLNASGIFQQLKIVFESAAIDNRINNPAATGVGYTQYLLLLSDIEVLISEFDFAQDVLIRHAAESNNNLLLWFDMAHTAGQEICINNQQRFISTPVQHNAYLFNSAYSFSQFRSKGTRGKSILVFLPSALMEKLFNAGYLQDVLSNYYAVLCRDIEFARLSPSQERKINSVFYQWHKNRNLVSITKNIHQLTEWFFLHFFRQFAAIDERVSNEETVDLLAIEDALKINLDMASPDINSLKKITALPFNQLEEKFRKLHNKTIHQYFKEQKIIKGMSYLRQGQHVSDVAYSLGYANPSNFSSSFKKMYGITADEFRRQFENN